MLSVGNEGGTDIGGDMREGRSESEGRRLVLTPVVALMYDLI